MRATEDAPLNLDAIPAGRNPPIDLNVFVEIPLGGVPVKYELDKKTGALFVDRFLHTAMYYPGNYGFIPQTLSEDGDPCDVLVISQVPVVSGAIIRCRPLGALVMEDEGGAGMRRSSPCRSTPCIRSTAAFAPIRSYRHSSATRSRISSSTTRISSPANGSQSRAGSMWRRPRPWS